MIQIVTLLAVVSCSKVSVSGFLTSSVCQKALPATCSCGESYFLTSNVPYFLINCNGYQVVDFPTIHRISVTTSFLTLNFCCNRITRIPANAFINLHFTKPASTVYVDFHTSMLTDIDINAFNGIAALVTGVDLQNNHLTRVPAAIGTLPNLKTLLIANNPIVTADPSVMKLRHLNIVGDLANILKESVVDVSTADHDGK